MGLALLLLVSSIAPAQVQQIATLPSDSKPSRWMPRAISIWQVPMRRDLCQP